MKMVYTYGDYEDGYVRYEGSSGECFANSYFASHDEADSLAPATPVSGSPSTLALTQLLPAIALSIAASHSAPLPSSCPTLPPHTPNPASPSAQLKHSLPNSMASPVVESLFGASSLTTSTLLSCLRSEEIVVLLSGMITDAGVVVLWYFR